MGIEFKASHDGAWGNVNDGKVSGVTAPDPHSWNPFKDAETTPVQLANGQTVYVSEQAKAKLDEWIKDPNKTIEPCPKGHVNPERVF